jgi:hypothetical protein
MPLASQSTSRRSSGVTVCSRSGVRLPSFGATSIVLPLMPIVMPAGIHFERPRVLNLSTATDRSTTR